MTYVFRALLSETRPLPRWPQAACRPWPVKSGESRRAREMHGKTHTTPTKREKRTRPPRHVAGVSARVDLARAPRTYVRAPMRSSGGSASTAASDGLPGARVDGCAVYLTSFARAWAMGQASLTIFLKRNYI